MLNHPLIGERYFFPRAEAPIDPFWVDCGDVRLACAYRPVADSAPTLVHFHGNGEVAADWLGGFAKFINGCGWNLFLAEMRGYGASTGSPRLGKMLEDVPRILSAINRKPEHLVMFGRSVGSLFAIEAVKRDPGIAGLVLESGVADIRERLLMRLSPAELGVDEGEFDRVLSETFDHRATLSAFKNPVLVLHAQYDTLIDISHGRHLAAWAGGKVQTAFFPRGDHNDILFANEESYLTVLKQFLAEIHCGQVMAKKKIKGG